MTNYSAGSQLSILYYSLLFLHIANQVGLFKVDFSWFIVIMWIVNMYLNNNLNKSKL